MTMEVTFYMRQGCHICDHAAAILSRLRRRVQFELEEIDIDGDESLRARYNEQVPVIAIDGEDLFWGAIDESALMARLRKRG